MESCNNFRLGLENTDDHSIQLTYVVKSSLRSFDIFFDWMIISFNYSFTLTCRPRVPFHYSSPSPQL